jgi:hypothetical protein
MLVTQRIEKIQQRWKRVLQCRIERKDPLRYFLADRLRAVTDVDLEITPKQLDDRQIRRCATVRSGAGFNNQPVHSVVRMKKLVH